MAKRRDADPTASARRRASSNANAKATTKNAVAAAFDYSLDFSRIDFRRRPDLYRIGRGEQGVLLVEPYKSEILPHWRFRTPALARRSAAKIYALFLDYKAQGDFVGMDMARKFLQMGYTRARRYANHRSGRKYAVGSDEVLPRTEDPVKAQAAELFRARWRAAAADARYLELKRAHRTRFEGRC
jgi:hypothetical protein